MCNGCSSCEKVCPYGAITYIDKEFRVPEPHDADPPRGVRSTRRSARAAARARSPARPARWISRASRTNRSWRRWTRYAGKSKNGFKPTIVAFCCNWCSYAGADLVRHQPAASIRRTSRSSAFPAPAALNPMFILRAFQRGADGVILCGCHPGDCHYTTGNYYARRRMTLLFSHARLSWALSGSGRESSGSLPPRAQSSPPR